MKTIAMFVICIFFAVVTKSQKPIETVIQLETTVTENPPSISFNWNEIPGNFDVIIFRKSSDNDIWTRIDTIPPGKTVFTDKDVQTGMEYEYRLESLKPDPIKTITYVPSGIQCRENEYRGKVILLVDDIFSDPLKLELYRLESDLIGDGWEVIRKDISRNSSVKDVKSFICETYFSDSLNVKSVFLVGHIPVPYSGDFAFDGHKGEHDGAWPADVYYGDMNESFWIDATVNNTNSIHRENYNIPGDGKFDRSKLDKKQNISLAVGRVDFVNLPAFSQTEVELMRNYLNKDHAFRHKMIDPKMQALVDDNFGTLEYYGGMMQEMFALSGWRNFTALFNFENIKAGHFFEETNHDSYLWSYGCDDGTYTTCKEVGNATDFANNAPKTVFTAFYGSWFGDWNSENNFLRSALASHGWILTSCLAGRPQSYFQHMGMGKTTGECINITQNNKYTYNTGYYSGLPQYKRAICVSLMGDPTLRMHVVEPVQAIHSEKTENNSIQLNWSAPGDEIIGYHVYKMDTVTGKYARITDEVITETFFTDDLPEEGNNYYMVRVLQLTHSASGSYYNLSQGVFDTVRYIQAEQNLVNQIKPVNEIEVTVFPNPAQEYVNVRTSGMLGNIITLTTLNGSVVYSSRIENDLQQVDISNLRSGIYLVIIKTPQGNHSQKIVKM